jgi:nucleotide-binding universal stress UspA family protein
MAAVLLVPTDFSEYSERALAYAISLSRILGSDVLLHHNIEHTISSGNNAYLSDKIYQDNRQKAIEQMQNLADKYAGFAYLRKEGTVQIKTALTTQKTEESILKLIEDNQVSMLVMGTKGKGAMERIFLGSTTVDMVELAPCPVLVVPEEAQFSGWEYVVYAGEFSEADPQAVELVYFLAKELEAKLTYLHISSDEEYILDDVKRLGELESQFTFTPTQMDFVLLTERSFKAGLKEYLSQQSVDILVMYRQQRSFFESLWHSSLTKEMTFHSKIPLLILKKKK